MEAVCSFHRHSVCSLQMEAIYCFQWKTVYSSYSSPCPCTGRQSVVLTRKQSVDRLKFLASTKKQMVAICSFFREVIPTRESLYFPLGNQSYFHSEADCSFHMTAVCNSMGSQVILSTQCSSPQVSPTLLKAIT